MPPPHFKLVFYFGTICKHLISLDSWTWFRTWLRRFLIVAYIYLHFSNVYRHIMISSQHSKNVSLTAQSCPEPHYSTQQCQWIARHFCAARSVNLHWFFKMAGKGKKGNTNRIACKKITALHLTLPLPTCPCIWGRGRPIYSFGSTLLGFLAFVISYKHHMIFGMYSGFSF